MKEDEIRPKKVFNTYLELSAKDAEKCFSEKNREPINCPACGTENQEIDFVKNSFPYILCKSCDSLYQSPRAPLWEYEEFYHNSESSKYWATEFFPAVAEVRRDKIFKPRAEKISELCQKNHHKPEVVMDVGGGYGLFLEEWRKIHPNSHVCTVEPSEDLAETCRKKEIEVLQTISEKADEWKNRGDLVTCFEVIEHAHNPLEFIQSIYNLVKPGGYAIVSGLGVDGFDIQVLWEKSNSISPPHHINFLSVKGFYQLFEKAGFSNIEVLTPGQLDVDIVKNSLEKHPELLKENRFLKKLYQQDENTLTEFQNFLTDNKLSSHTWIVGYKK